MKAIIAVLLLGVIAAQAQHPVATLTDAKADSYAAIVEAAGATKAFSDGKAKVTLLVPTNEAVAAFLKEMGLTLDDVKKNPQLAKHIVGYHTILGVTAGPKELFAKKDKVKVPTADEHYLLTVMKKGDKVVVKDVQGNKATVTKASLGKGAHTVHMIDRVLYSGSYFKDLASVIKAFPTYFSTAAAAATKAGLADALTKQDFSNTLFLPTNKAFKAAGIKVNDTAKATLEDVLKYHVVAGARQMPGDFEAGKKVPTLLKGQDVTVTYKDEGKPQLGMQDKRAYVNDVAVIKPNLILSKGVVHVIDGVLMPKAAAPAAVSTEKAPAAKPAAAPAAKPAAKTGSRKLLVRGAGGGEGDSSFAPTIAIDSTEQAIYQALQSPGRFSSAVKGAARAGVDNSEVLSRFPEQATYANGISGNIAGTIGGDK